MFNRVLIVVIENWCKKKHFLSYPYLWKIYRKASFTLFVSDSSQSFKETECIDNVKYMEMVESGQSQANTPLLQFEKIRKKIFLLRIDLQKSPDNLEELLKARMLHFDTIYFFYRYAFEKIIPQSVDFYSYVCEKFNVCVESDFFLKSLDVAVVMCAVPKIGWFLYTKKPQELYEHLIHYPDLGVFFSKSEQENSFYGSYPGTFSASLLINDVRQSIPNFIVTPKVIKGERKCDRMEATMKDPFLSLSFYDRHYHCTMVKHSGGNIKSFSSIITDIDFVNYILHDTPISTSYQNFFLRLSLGEHYIQEGLFLQRNGLKEPLWIERRA